MGYIRETKLKKGGVRYQVRLRGHPHLQPYLIERQMLKLGSLKLKQIFAVAGITSIQRVSIIPLKKPLIDIVKNKRFQSLNVAISCGGKKSLVLSFFKMSDRKFYLRKSKSF